MDENGRKRLDEHLLARIADARRTEPHRLQVEIRASASSMACTESCFWMSVTRKYVWGK